MIKNETSKISLTFSCYIIVLYIMKHFMLCYVVIT